jgi:alpha-methylacyl-CoA racemase
MVGDFGGGSMFLVFGILAALVERQTSGRGQVVDTAMVDGALALSHMMWSFRGNGLWSDERGVNMLDTGAHFYEVYETSDGKYMAVGAIEPQFYALLLKGLELDPADLPHQLDKSSWPEMKKVFAEKFLSRTRDEWSEVFLGTDACVTPVLTFAEAPQNAHLAARGSLIEVDGVVQHAPAPRFSRTPSGEPAAPAGEATDIDTLWV